MFLFIRGIQEGSPANEGIGQNFRLLDANTRQVICTFDNNEIQKDDHFGWFAFSCAISPGFFLLKYGGKPEREIPLHCFPEIQTQLFLMHHYQPQFPSMRIYMNRHGWGFDPTDPLFHAYERALTALQNGVGYIPSNMLNELLWGKWENPTVGIAGAHILLQMEQVNRLKKVNQSKENLLETVMNNLEERIIRDSPDVSALYAMIEQQFGWNWAYRDESLTMAPMFRQGLESSWLISIERPGFIQENSLVEQSALHVFKDVPFTSWEPFLPVHTPSWSFRSEDNVEKTMELGESMPELFDFEETGEETPEREKPKKYGWLAFALQDEIQRKNKRKLPLDLSEFAKSQKLPLRVVENAYASLQENSDL